MTDSPSVVEKILQELETAKISFTLSRDREDAISVHVTVPGERWEIDIYDGGDVSFEMFSSSGSIYGSDELFARIEIFHD